jgi:hypothetical protein
MNTMAPMGGGESVTPLSLIRLSFWILNAAQGFTLIARSQ